MKTVGVALLALASVAAATRTAPERIQDVIRAPGAASRHLLGGSHMVQLLNEADTPAERLDGVSTMWYTQKLDHFNHADTSTYRQRFYVNDAFWNGDGPVFVYIGGEAELSPYSVAGGVQYDLAQKAGALLLGLEHRYYGSSQPFPTLTPAHLGWLSSQQALADLATWITALPTLLNKPSLAGAKVITFGGSYPGALAAWSRLKYPHLIHAAWSSSGPVQADEDFSGYMNVVAASLADPAVGGSPQCVQQLKSVFDSVVDAVRSNDPATRSSTASDFCLCDNYALGTEDVDNVISSITNNLAYAVQYNDQLPTPGLTVQGLCSKITPTSSEAGAYAAFKAWYLETTFPGASSCPATCVDASFKALLEEQDVTATSAEANGVGVRSWFWQTCSQFAYFQTCEASSDCVFKGTSSLDSVDLAYFTDVCDQDYAFPASNVTSAVDFTNAYYGGNSTVADRVVYVSGTVDPWHYLAVHHTLAPESPAVFIPGMSHCQDLRSQGPDDTPQLVAGRNKAIGYIQQWLNEE